VSELVAAPATKQAPSTSVPAFNWLWLALALAIALLVLVLRSLYSKSATTPAVPRMTEQEREQALLQVRAWLAQSSESGGGRPL
jgi:heme exporter protein D